MAKDYNYIVYEDIVLVLIVACSDKKAQQATIDAIKKAFDFYKKEVYEQLANKK